MVQNLLVANLESFNIIWAFFVGCVISAKLSSKFVVMQHREKVGWNEVNREPIIDWRDQNGVIF